MTLDDRLIALLVCPVCKGALALRRDDDFVATELVCPADRLGFPIRDGNPVLLENEARALAVDEPTPP